MTFCFAVRKAGFKKLFLSKADLLITMLDFNGNKETNIMPNIALARLQQLTHNRFALTNLGANFWAVRDYLARHYQSQDHAPTLAVDKLWLIGTVGCHLCEDVQVMLERLHATQNLPAVQVLEVLDFDDEIAQILAPLIPVLIFDVALLTYPFGLMDILQACQH
ncbi:MAG: glutaredoxin family protein [Moraxella sp.]|nr:glutaredoxin family protein [Moraxella sp.]